MNCTREDLKSRLTDALVGEADEALSADLMAHMETCGSCRDDRDRLAAMLGVLRDLPPWSALDAAASEAQAPDSQDRMTDAQKKSIRDAVSFGSTGSGGRPRTPSRFGGAWLALAAGLTAVSLGVLLRLPEVRGPEGTGAEAPEARVAGAVHEPPPAPVGPTIVRTPDPTPSAQVARLAARETPRPASLSVATEALREAERSAESGVSADATRNEAPSARATAARVPAAPQPALALGLLRVSGSKDPLVEGLALRLSVSRAPVRTVVCFEPGAAVVGVARFGGGSVNAPCVGRVGFTPAPDGTGQAFVHVPPARKTHGTLGRLVLRQSASGVPGAEIASQAVEAEAVQGEFENADLEFRIAYIEARAAEGLDTATREALLELVAELPEGPRARALVDLVRSSPIRD